jgi:hypothetical protein
VRGDWGPGCPSGWVTRVWRTRTRNCLSILGTGKRLSFIQTIWTGYETHRASYSWYGGGTAASVYCECGVVQLPPSIANVGWYSCLRLLRMWGGTAASVCCECGVVQLPPSIANVGWYSSLHLLRMWGGTAASVYCECYERVEIYHCCTSRPSRHDGNYTVGINIDYDGNCTVGINIDYDGNCTVGINIDYVLHSLRMEMTLN